MVAPVTGPFSKVWSSSWPSGFTSSGYVNGRLNRTWYRQRAPFDRPLAFTSSGNRGVWQAGASSSPHARPVTSDYCWVSTPTVSSSNAYNNAWSKFDEKMRGQAEWAVTLLQYRQSYDALVKHTTDLYRVFRDIRRGRFGDLYQRFKPPKGFKMKGKSVADQILEWRFGWLPLWGDIHDSAEALGRDLGDFQVVGKGSGRWTEESVYENIGVYAHIVEKRRASYNQRYRLSADVRITNPNMLLLDSLGLTNPALVAYEMISFSFILNYFINLEEFCRGLSPYMGMEMINSCTTHFTTVKTSLSGSYVRIANPPLFPNRGPYEVVLDGWTMTRSLGPISGPKLRIRDPWILQPGRGINCVALLLQQLGRKRG